MGEPHCHIGKVTWYYDRYTGRRLNVPIVEVRLRPGWLQREIDLAHAEIATWPEGLREQTPAARYRRMKEQARG